MGIKVTMDSGAAYVAHEARAEGTHNAEPVMVYVVREATTGDVVGEVRREARPSMDGPGMDAMWVHAGGEADALWRAVRAIVGGKVVNVETTDEPTTGDDAAGPNNAPHNALRYHVSGAVARGEATPIVAMEADDADDYAPACPACGEPVDYCRGHGEVGDPRGAAILAAHDDGDHTRCSSRGCEDERETYCDHPDHHGHPLRPGDETTTFPRWVGMVMFGPDYAEPDAATDCYVWDTLDAVRASVASIVRGQGVAAHAAEWTHDGFGAARAGHRVDSLTPAAYEPRIVLWRNGPDVLRVMEEDGPVMADRVAYVGPRGAVRVSTDLMAGAL